MFEIECIKIITNLVVIFLYLKKEYREVSILKQTTKYLFLAILVIGMAGTASAGLFVGAYNFMPFTENIPLDNGSVIRQHYLTVSLEETGVPTEWSVSKNNEQIASGWYNGNCTTVEVCYAEEIITAMEAKKSPVSNFSLSMATSEGESFHIDFSEVAEWDYYDNYSGVPLQVWGMRDEGTSPGMLEINTIMSQYSKYMIVRNCGFETFYGKIRLSLRDNGHDRNVETEVLTIPPGEVKEVFVGNYSSGNNNVFLWGPLYYSPQFPEETTSWYCY